MQSWDKKTTVNNRLLERRSQSVPTDPYLKGLNWTYAVGARYEGNDDFFKNDQIVKVFLLAHNASKIVISGRAELIDQYKNYFISNGVSAEILLEEISPDYCDTVTILLTNQQQGGKDEETIVISDEYLERHYTFCR